MPLDVIGSGFGRTGTTTLKAALEQLGFGPCHHMLEVFSDPPQVARWQALARGEPPDWEAVFAGYRAQVDWPGAAVWRELFAANPQAKVIHSVRPEEDWWRSFSGTIAKLTDRRDALDLPPHIRDMLEAWVVFAKQPVFGDGMLDRDTAIQAFRRREAEVREIVPPEQLLVFDVSDGWEPLCSFLGAQVRDAPFPRRNPRTEFWDDLGGEPA